MSEASLGHAQDSQLRVHLLYEQPQPSRTRASSRVSLLLAHTNVLMDVNNFRGLVRNLPKSLDYHRCVVEKPLLFTSQL